MSLKRQLMFIHVFFAVMGIGLLVALVLRATLGTKFEPQERKYAIPSGDLVMRLTDPATRVETVRECGRKRDRSAVPLLRGFCRDKSPEVRLACAWALGEIGDTEAVYALRVRLSDRDVAVREEAAKALGKLGTGGDGVALASLLNALEDKAIDVKRAAIGGVAGVPGIDATEALARALSGEMPLPIRMRAVEALSDREGQPASRLLGVALNDTEAVIRRAAIQALIPRRDTAAYSAAASALRDADEGVRTGALKAIEAMGQPVLPALTKVLPTTGSMAVRLAAARILKTAEGEQAKVALMALLEGVGRRGQGETQALANEVIEAMALRGESGLPVLTRFTIDGESSVLSEHAAAEVCRKIGKPAVKPIVDNILKWKLYHDPDELKMWLDVLGDIGDPAAAEALNRALSQDIDGMPELVADVRARIEKKSGVKLPPPAPHPVAFHQPVANPGLLELPPIPRPPTTRRIERIPDDGVLHVCLRDALLRPHNRTPADLDIELIRRDGKWQTELWGRSIFYNRQHYPGYVIEDSTTADGATIRVGVVMPNDGWVRGGYGEYEIKIQKGTDGKMRGQFGGHYDLQPRTGAAHVECREGKIAVDDKIAVAPGEHPRLFFRSEHLPVLRARARTDLGRKIIKVLQARIVGAKAYDWREKVNAVAYAGEVQRAIAMGFLANIFDDPPHGRRAARSVYAHNKVDPYAGEHGGPELPCLAMMGFAYDLAYNYHTQQERDEMLPKKLWFMNVISARHGMLGPYGDGGMGFPCPRVLALMREKGKLDAFPPGDIRQVVAATPEEELVVGEGVPVVPLQTKKMMGQWLFTGPFDPESDEGEPLGKLGGPAKARPAQGTYVAHGKLTLRVLPVREEFVRSAPGFGARDQCIVLPGADVASVSYLYSVLKVDKLQGVAIDCRHPINPRPSRIWLNGQEVENGAVVTLQPGYYHTMISFTGPAVCPCLFSVDAGYWHGRKKIHEFYMADYERARAAHEKTGELQSVRYVLGYVRRGFRNLMRYEVDSARKAGLPDLGGISYGLGPYQTAVGEPLIRDSPLPVNAYPAVAWSSMKPDKIPEIFRLASPEIQPALLWEFNRHYLPDNLSRLSIPMLINTFVNYPLGMEPRHPDEVLPRHTADPERGFYAFYGGKGRFSLRVNARNVLPGRTVRHVPKAGSFRLRGMGINWVMDAGIAGSRVWFPAKEAELRGLKWIERGSDWDQSSAFEAIARVEGSRMLGCGKVKYFKPEADGSGAVGLDLTEAYSEGSDVPVEAERHIAVDYSGKSGSPAVVAVVDRIRGGGKKIWTLPGRAYDAHVRGKRYWIYRKTGKGTETLGEAAVSPEDTMARGDKDFVYVARKARGKAEASSTLRAHFVSPDEFETTTFHIGYGRGMNKCPTVLALKDEKNVDFFVVLTIQGDDSQAPLITVKGTGLDAVVSVGKQQVRFDGKRIVFGSGAPQMAKAEE